MSNYRGSRMVTKEIKSGEVEPLLGAYTRLSARPDGSLPYMRARVAALLARSIMNLQQDADRIEQVWLQILGDGLGEEGSDLRKKQDERLDELANEEVSVHVAELDGRELEEDGVLVEPTAFVVLFYHNLLRD